MARIDVLDILRRKRQSPLEFDFDNLWIPPIYTYLSQQDIDALRCIATSIRLSSRIEEKYKMIDDIMRNRGFKRFAAGTNRVVYSFLEDDRFLVKIAVDKVGMQDNPMEYKNQFLLKPYVAKMFYTSQCGTVGFAERVLPIKNKAEFKEIADDVFEILVNKILGMFVVEDVGTKFFMNWGIRKFHAPVLLDYPYVYKLDGKKLYCSNIDPILGPCDGEIDYDAGFNHLTCVKCGKKYLACNLRDDSEENTIIIKGGRTMKVSIITGDKTIASTATTEKVIRRPAKSSKGASYAMKVSIINTDCIGVSVSPRKEVIQKPKFKDMGIKTHITGINQADEDAKEIDTVESETKAAEPTSEVETIPEVEENSETEIEIETAEESEEEVAEAAEINEDNAEEAESDDTVVEENNTKVDEIASEYDDYDDDYINSKPIRSKGSRKKQPYDEDLVKKKNNRIPKR